MPTYEYHCPQCEATYELRQGFDAQTTHTCGECGNGTAKRVLYAPPVVFKGSGWYVTDSRGKSSAPAESKSEPAAATKSESKPETKAAASETSASPEAAAAS